MTNTYNAVITAIYKPTVHAIQYTGDFNKVFDFIGGNVTRFEWINNDLQSHINIKTDNGVAVSTLRLGDYLVKETFEDGNATGGDVEYKTMSEDEFKRYYKELTEPEPIVADTTPKTGCVSPESGGAAMRSVLKAMEAAKVTSAPCEDKPEQVGRVDYSENYYYIDSFGAICCTSDLDTHMDINRYESDNYFRTEQEALQVRDEWQLQLKYRQWRKRYDPVVLDWRDGNQQKWYMRHWALGGERRGIEIDYAYGAIEVGTLYFSTRDLAERFYNEHKDLIHNAIGNGDVIGNGDAMEAE